MKLLITGAAGYLGSVVTEHLHAVGHRVVATDLRYRPGLPVRLELADLTDPHAAYRLLDGTDAVVHLSNLRNARAGTAQHILGYNTAVNANVFVAARELGIKRIVFASTIQTFLTPVDDTEPDTPRCRLPYLPIDGNAPAVPDNNYYALSKIFAEQLLMGLAQGDPEMVCTALRFPYLAGFKHLQWMEHKPGGRRDRAARFTAELIQGRPGPSRPHWVSEGMTYLKLIDAARVIAAALERQGPGYHSYFPAQVFDAQGMTAQRVIAEWFAGVPARDAGQTPDRIVDLDRLESDLGWSPADPPVQRALSR